MGRERVVMQTQPKAPEEIMHVPGVDFGPRMTVAGEQLASATVAIAERASGTDRTAEMLVPGSVVVSNNVVSFQLRGGIDARDYVARIDGSTNQQRVERAALLVPVRARAKAAP
ncbi:MAG: hypothetical protein QN174_07775 [Armatimonadota bacterium]|nr:hypothetical protein [Armatimonadota bacterium]